MDAAQAKILVVEDHADSAVLVSKALWARGYHIQIATSYAEAIKILASNEFDVLLSDLALRDGDGCELMRAMQAASWP